jgi:16S rRNA processing protein RimM
MKINPDDLHMMGRVHSSQGVKGAIYILLETQNPEWLDEWNTLFLTPGPDSRVFTSYPIRRKSPHGKQGLKGYIVELENIDDRDLAEKLVKNSVWVPKEFIASKKGETIYLREILGFIVVDEERGEVGPIIDFSTNTAQDLLVVDFKGESYDIPFVDAFIQKIDFKNKKVFMDIPQGLLGEE